MRLICFVFLCFASPCFGQIKLPNPPIDALSSDALKMAFLEKLYQRDEWVKAMGDTLTLQLDESKEEREKRLQQIELADSINYYLVNRYIELYGFTYGSGWSHEAKYALFKVVHRSVDTRFRLKHFPVIKVAYDTGKIDRGSIVVYLCKTIQDNKIQLDPECTDRDLEKLFEKVKNMYDRYFWWK